MIPEKHLASRKPWILIDRVTGVEAGKSISVLKQITNSDFFIQGHFPQLSIYPGMLLVEGLKQSAELLLVASGYGFQEKPCQISEVRAKFIRPLMPGDTIHFHVSWVKEERQTVNLSAVGMLGDSEVVRCRLKIM